jgi:hypothetical protein
MKNLLLLIILLFVLCYCTKKWDSPSPAKQEPKTVEPEVATLPEPYYPRMRSAKLECCPYSGWWYSIYETYAGHDDKHVPKADLWHIKAYNIGSSGKEEISIDSNIRVWWVNDIPNSYFYHFKKDTDGGWLKTPTRKDNNYNFATFQSYADNQ